ncbi:MAG: flagellar export protein FliJ [candidate division Zixibacteria bacterium]|nr:flagellar export protein FliJ [candidate division Zixibacteria bacterium]
MKRFNFRFEKVLSYRRHQEKGKQRELAQVRNREEKQKKEIHGIVKDHSNQQQSQKSQLVGTINPLRMTAFSRYYLKLKQLEFIGRETLKTIKKEVEEKRGKLVEATKQRKIYEKLKEKHLEEYTVEYNLMLQKENDEIGLKVFARQK